MGLTIEEFISVYCQSDLNGGLVLNVDATNNDLSDILTTSNASGGRSVKVTVVSGPGMTYVGTANRITITGNVIDIAATYVGQTSITTLGTIGTGVWQATAITDSYISSAATWNAKENALTFSSGLTRTTNNITNNLITGISGGQTIIGGTGDGDTLIIKGTSGNGTVSIAGIQLTVGNNGGLTAIAAFNDSRIVMGGTSISSESRQLRILQESASVEIGSFYGNGALWGIYGCLTPSATNYSLGGTNGGITLLNGSSVYHRIDNNDIFQVSSTSITVSDSINFVLNTSTGTKWGTATNQKQGWYGVAPVVQQAAVTPASGGIVIDIEARAAINDLITKIQTLGFTA